MPARCPIVPPDRVRLYLADVHRAKVARLQQEILPLAKAGKTDLVTAKQAEIVREEASAADCEAFGDFIDVRKRLNAGEYREMLSSQFKETTFGEAAKIDLGQVGITKVQAFVIGWSFVEADGLTPLPFDASTLKAIDPDVFADIVAAVDAHDEAMEAARVAEKNARGSLTASAAI